LEIEVRAHGDMKRAIGTEKTSVKLEEGARIRDLVLRLGGKVERSGRAFLGVHKLVDSALVVLVNGRNIHALDGIDTVLKEGDLVTFMPVIPGG